MYIKRALGICVAGAVFGGCGGTKKPPAEPNKVVTSGPSRNEAPATELTRLAAPKDLIAIARVEHLDNVSATIAQWMSLPFDLRMLDALGPGLSRTLVLSAPIEAAVTLADGSETEVPQPYAVFTAGLASTEAGRTLFEQFGRKLEESSPGVWVTTDESPLACAVAPSLGRAPVRLVCGDRRVDVENLLPYATRGLPLEAMGTADMHVELKLLPIRERYGQRLRQAKAMAVPMALGWFGISDTRLSRPITDILYALGDEIVDIIDDLDHVSFDSRIAATPDRIDISTSFAFTRTFSWLAQALADASKRAGPAPPMFFDLPKDAGLASYVAPGNPKLFENTMHRLEALIDGALAHIDVNQKLRDDFIRSLDQFGTSASGGACGEGSPAGHAANDSTKVNALGSISAWQVCVYDALPPSAFTSVLETGARLMSNKQLERAIGEGGLSLRRRATARGLPAGTSVYDLQINTKVLGAALANLASKSADSAKSDTKASKTDSADIGNLHIYISPDGYRTWTGFGTDAKAVEAHLLAARKATSNGRLGGVPDLAWLSKVSAVSGGFTTLAHVGAALAARGQQRGISKSSVDEGLAAAPHHGQIPIPYTVQVRGEPSAPELLLEARIDKAQFEDLVAIGGQSVLKFGK